MKVTREFKREVEERVSSGVYASVDEVLSKALEALRDQELWEAEVRMKVDHAREQLDRGESIPMEEVFADLRKRFVAEQHGS